MVSGMPSLKVLILTGRTIGQGTGKEKGKLSEEYGTNVAICEMDPNDMKQIRVRENNNIRISTDFGSVVVRVVESARSPHLGVVFIPYGLWANVVMDPQTHGTGMPSLKGIPAVIEPAPDTRVMSLVDLLEEFRSKR